MKYQPIYRIVISLLIGVSVELTGCATTDTSEATVPERRLEGERKVEVPSEHSSNKSNVDAVRNTDAGHAAESCQKNVKGKTFDEFKKKVFKEPGPNGKFIVNGDTPISSEKLLKEFFEKFKDCNTAPVSSKPIELTIFSLNGVDITWNNLDKTNLSYCVSTRFGSNHSQVVQSMLAATSAWEKVANVKFIYTPDQNGNCTSSNPIVLFDVNPVNVGGEYLARAFFPNDIRVARNVLIDNSAFQLNPGDKLTLTGILRHELGHTLGFRHEHTRPEAGACFEDNNFRPEGDYDAFSVMHYPQCNGKGDWSLNLTELDKQGAACIYGAATGFQFDSSKCVRPATPDPVPTEGSKKVTNFSNQRVRRDQEIDYGPFDVVPGSVFSVVMTGKRNAGDPDLYVRFGSEPDRVALKYSCRPFVTGVNEQCILDVPGFDREAYVMVYGYASGKYNLRIEYTQP